MGIVAARTIRRLPTTEREESIVAVRGTKRQLEMPPVTKHIVERRKMFVVPAISGAPLQVGSGESVSAPRNTVPNLPEPFVVRAQASLAAVKAANIQV